MISLVLMRVIEKHAGPWLALGWKLAGGHESPSVGACVLLEWTGEGDPVVPEMP